MDQEIIDYCKSEADNLRHFASIEDWRMRSGDTRPTIGSFGAKCLVVYRNESGVLRFLELQGQCHGGLSYQSKRPVTEAILTYVMPFDVKHTHNWTDKETYYNWLYWIANQSIAADAFITKDPEEMIKDGCIIDPNAHLGMFMMALILTRVGSELHTRMYGVQILEACLKRGVLPQLACGIAFHSECCSFLPNAKTRSSKLGVGRFNMGKGHYSHNPFVIAGFHEEAFIKFLKGEPAKVEPTPYKTSNIYSGVWQLAGVLPGQGGTAQGCTRELFEGLNKAITPHLAKIAPPKGYDSGVLIEKGDDKKAFEAVADYLFNIQQQVDLPIKDWKWEF